MEELARGRDNNFNLIRMIAASAVIVSHSFPLSLGMGTPEPFAFLHPLDVGKAAVRIFFVISGFFIMKSFDRRSSLGSYAAARIGRIAPALLVVTCLTSIMTWAGIGFASNPYPDLVNGPLWTLWYEGTCYIVLALAGLCGLYANGRFGAFLIGFGLAYASIQLRILPLNTAYATLGFPFVLGIAAYHFRRVIPLDWRVALTLIVGALISPSDASWSLALGYAAMWLGGANLPALKHYNRLGDYSYGTYIFGWPIQQLLALFVPGISPFEMMVVALPAAWALGALSWHFVESPALDFSHRLGKISPPAGRLACRSHTSSFRRFL